MPRTDRDFGVFGAAQFGVGSDGCHAVSRHVHFGYNRDVSGLGKGDNFFDVFLRVKSAIGGCFTVFSGFKLPPFSVSLHPTTANLGEFWERFYLNSPALVVSQMPMKGVEFVARKMVNVAFNFFFLKEMAAAIKHQTPPAEAGIIGDFSRRNRPICRNY